MSFLTEVVMKIGCFVRSSILRLMHWPTKESAVLVWFNNTDTIPVEWKTTWKGCQVCSAVLDHQLCVDVSSGKEFTEWFDVLQRRSLKAHFPSWRKWWRYWWRKRLSQLIGTRDTCTIFDYDTFWKSIQAKSSSLGSVGPWQCPLLQKDQHNIT